MVPDQTEDCKEWEGLEKRVLGEGELEMVMEYMGCTSREKGISWCGGLAEERGIEDERGGGDESQQSVMADDIMKAIVY